MNRESSRSHAVFTLTIESKRKVGAGRGGEGREVSYYLVTLATPQRRLPMVRLRSGLPC